MSERHVVVGAAIVRCGTVLAARRTTPPEAAGRWEFPGGKVEPGELPAAALVREIREELDCQVEVTGWLAGAAPIGDHHELTVATCAVTRGEPDPVEHDAIRWLTPEQLGEVDWLEPDRPFLAELRDVLLDGEPLSGGDVGGVVRIGDTVRRETGPWTPGVHALLAHVAAAGLRGVPRVHGVDERGREVLDFVRGHVVDVGAELLSEPRLRDLGSWTREFHDAVADFDHPGPWRHVPLGVTDRIGHNDLAPYNVAFAGDEVVGVFDWDFAGPTTAQMELAHQAWNAVPLFRDIGTAASAGRLAALAGGYDIAAEELLNLVVTRFRASIEVTGAPSRTEQALAGLVARIPAIRATLHARD